MHSYSKSLVMLSAALAATDTDAFTAVNTPSRSRLHFSSLDATRDSTPADTFRNLAAASTLAFGLLFPTNNALAAPETTTTFNNNVLQSTSVSLSAEIKTMDFALPSSYDSIAAPVASGVTDELTQVTVINTSASKRTSQKAKGVEKQAKKKEAPPPGMSAKEVSAAKQAEKKAAREADEAAQKEADAKAAAERDENIKAARMAKIAAREEAKAAEQAAKDEGAQEAKMKDVKTMDTSMPSY